MPVPAVIQATDAISGPRNDVGCAGRHLLLAARTPVGLVCPSTADPTHEPLTVAEGLTPGGPAEGTVQIELCALGSSTVRAGHVPSVAGAGLEG